MESSFVKAMTVKKFLSLTPKPKNLYVQANCSMEICSGSIERPGSGFLRVTSVFRPGGECPQIWWVGTADTGGLDICVHEDRFLYRKKENTRCDAYGGKYEFEVEV